MPSRCCGRNCIVHPGRTIMKKNVFLFFITFSVTVIVLRNFSFSETRETPAAPIKEEKVDVHHDITPVTYYPVEKCVENVSVYNLTDFKTEPESMKDFLKYRHCKSFPLLLDAPMKCGSPKDSKDVFLLLAIKTAPQNYERREAIRKTWGAEKSYSGLKVKRVFLSGISRNRGEGKRMRQLLSAESHTYGDILQWEFEDTFYNLTLKQVLFHKWLDLRCPGAQFVFNGDDDVFVNALNVVTYLSDLGMHGLKGHLFVGSLNIGMPPVREKYTKYYVSEYLFPGNSFEPYCGGGGILMSGFTAHAISRESVHIPLFPIDDAYLGMCLKNAGLSPDNHQGIRTFGIQMPNQVDSFDACYYRDMLMVHRFMPYEMLIMWKALQLAKPRCKKTLGK